MDRLKEYLIGRKDDLDIDSPPAGTWENIESKMARPGISSWVRYATAACVIALAGVGLWLVVRNSGVPAVGKERAKTESPRPKEEPAPGKDIAQDDSIPKPVKAGPPKPVETADEVDVIGKSYSRLIDQELKKLRATPLYAENGNYFSFYVEQLKQMDRDERAVRNDIKAYGLTSEFLEQLINVYQQKLNVLKDLRTEINKMNNKVREKQAPTEKPQIHYLNL